MKILLTLFLALSILTLIFITTLILSIYIHNNFKGTRVWKFINKYIIANEDDYINKK